MLLLAVADMPGTRILCKAPFAASFRAAHDQLCVTQVWQWLRHGVALDGGSVITAPRFAAILEEEMTKLRAKLGAERFDGGHFVQVHTCAWTLAGQALLDYCSCWPMYDVMCLQAVRLFDEFSTSERLSDFLTLPAYEYLVQCPPTISSRL